MPVLKIYKVGCLLFLSSSRFSSSIENAKAGAEQKELDDLVCTLEGDRLFLCKACMEGTWQTILQEIEDAVNKVDGHNIIWIRGSPGVGKSALVASISTWLQDQGRRVIPFCFDRTKSTKITTEALWHVVACDLARWYPALRQHLAKGIEVWGQPKWTPGDSSVKL